MSDGWASSRDETRTINYATEPTHRRPVPLPPHPPRRRTRRERRRSRRGTGEPSRAVTVALVAFCALLLALIMVVGNL